MSIKNSFAYANHCEEKRRCKVALHNAGVFKRLGNMKAWNLLCIAATTHAHNARLWMRFA